MKKQQDVLHPLLLVTDPKNNKGFQLATNFFAQSMGGQEFVSRKLFVKDQHEACAQQGL